MKKLLVLILLISATAANADLTNAKNVESVRVKITYGGSLETAGAVQRANVSYYIPQSGIESINVEANGDMQWRYTYDDFGNKLVLMEWNRPTGDIYYSIETVVDNRAVHTYSDKAVGSDSRYTQQSRYIVISDAIREASFPNEKSMKKAAETAKFVYDYVTYNLGYVGKNEPSDTVFKDRQGVCVEHANLMAAMLRANDIPTRYVVGYAYSALQRKFIGHTWLEVLDADGGWVPFDPTWLQAGFIDATHIKSAVLLDNNQIDTLSYVGGSIKWTRNDDDIRLLDYTEGSLTQISASGPDSVDTDTYGYLKADVSTDECTIVMLTATSCMAAGGGRPLHVYQPNRTYWMCAPKEVYWFFKATDKNYICPTLIYDQTGAEAEHRVTVSEGTNAKEVSISGPSSAGINEAFTLTASDDGLFYSPDFGMNDARTWNLKLSKPGTYEFYLYSEGGLAVKNIEVLAQKEFDIAVAAPAVVDLANAFDINVTVTSLLGGTAEIKAQYTNQTFRTTQVFEKGSEKQFSFRMQASKPGKNEVVVSAAGNTLASQTVTVFTPEKPKGFLDDLWAAIMNFLKMFGF